MRSIGPVVGAVLLFVLFAGAGSFFVYQLEQEHRSEHRRNVAQLAAGSAYSLERQITHSLAATYALSAILRQAGTINDFDLLADELMRTYGMLKAIQLAPGGVITAIHPLAGNERALGFDILHAPKRRTETLRAIESRQLVLAGPYALMQGGVGVVGRLAVFIPEVNGGERFWGLVNVTIRLSDLLATGRLVSLEKEGYGYELTRLNPDTERWEVIAGSGGPLRSPVESSIEVPGGTWKLAVAPRGGWQPSPLLPLKYLLVTGISGIMALLGYLMLRQPAMLRREVRLRTADLEEANRLLETEILDRCRVEEELRYLNADLERRVAERSAQLETSNRELESFSYSVSHDLRAPLRHLEGFGRILLEDYADQLGEEGMHCLERIGMAIRRMKLHIDSLLRLAHLGRDALQITEVDLSAMVREAAADLKASAPGRRAVFVIADGATARGDAELLRLALDNLLSNSWKFTEVRPEARIEFGVAQSGGKQEFFVRDNGVGFDMRYAARLFGAFERLHRPGDYDGAGIGLATVQRIIRLHGGDIRAEAVVNSGATFFFTLDSSRMPVGG